MTHFREIFEDMPAVLTVPMPLRHRRMEVIILPLDELQMNGKSMSTDASGWPLGFFEETFRSLPNLLERESQGDYEERETLKGYIGYPQRC